MLENPLNFQEHHTSSMAWPFAIIKKNFRILFVTFLLCTASWLLLIQSTGPDFVERGAILTTISPHFPKRPITTSTVTRITSCYSENNNVIAFIHITNESRQWHPLEVCAFRSAALMNPNSKICILTMAEMEEHPALSVLPNLSMDFLDTSLLFIGTPLMDWHEQLSSNISNKQERHRNWIYEMSDALRFVYLYKFGGTYMDTDVLSLRSIEDFENVVAFQGGDTINGAVMKFEPHHPFIKLALDSFKNHFVPGHWGSVGPSMITALHRSKKVNSSAYTVLEPSTFYPIPYWNHNLPFDPSQYKPVKTATNDSYTLHLWHYMDTKWWGNSSVIPAGSFVDEFLRTVCLKGFM